MLCSSELDYSKIRRQSMKTCERCSNLEKKYKILSAETSFEIKKLEEDMAHQKITLHLSHQKDIQKLNERLAQEKKDKEVENKKWIEKYDSMCRSYESKLSQKEKECQQKVVDMQVQLVKKVEIQKSEKELKIREQIDQLRGESEQYKKRLLYVKQQQKKLIQKFHSEQITKTFDKFKKEKEFMQEQKQKLTEQIKELEQNDLRNKTIQIQLSEELFYSKQENESLKEKIAQQQQTIKLCYAQLHTKEKVIEYIRKEYNERAKKIEAEYNRQKEELSQQHKKDIEGLLEKELQKCSLYENKLNEIEQKREKQVKIYQEQFEQVKTLIDENRCPPKFSNEITTLHHKLKNKEKEIQRAKADIKLYQLQIENNDQILTKFFVSPTMTSTTPDFRERKSKEYKIKNNRGSITGGLRPVSQLREKSPDHDLPYNQFQTTSLENLQFMSSSKTTKIL